VDDFAPRLAFFFRSARTTFFRGDRQVPGGAAAAYARIMRDRFGAKNPSRCGSASIARRAAASLTAGPQYKINGRPARAFQALSAVLGGAQEGLHTKRHGRGLRHSHEEA